MQRYYERTRLSNEAEGKAMALLSEAEAKKKGIILAAEAESERQRLESQGLTIAIESIAKAIAGELGMSMDHLTSKL